MVADSADVVNKAAGALRVRLGKELGLCRPDQFEFVWVVDFPLFEWNPDEKRYDSLHHPFTCPVPEDLPKLKPIRPIRSQAYDLVVNGSEIGGGSVRIHNLRFRRRSSICNISRKQAEDRFGFFLRALEYGRASRGLAFGLDRLVILLTQTDNIRDAIPFLNRGQCLLTRTVRCRSKQLDELNLRVQKHLHHRSES